MYYLESNSHDDAQQENNDDIIINKNDNMLLPTANSSDIMSNSETNIWKPEID